MQFLNHIPNAIIANIGFMALLYLVYFIMYKVGKLKSPQLYKIAVQLHLLGSFQFLFILFSPTHKIESLLPFQNNLLVLTSLPSQWFFTIGVIYLFILFIFIIKSFFQIQSLYHLKKRADYTDSKKWSTQLKDEFELSTHFKIGYSNAIQSPITFGWLDPVILLPFSICNQLTIEEIKSVLLHEIAHIIRYDYLIQIFISASHWILYFNPFSYLFIKEINLQREMACDKWVINLTNAPLTFSKALYNLAIIQNRDLSFNAFSLGILSRKNDLFLRVQNINNLKNNRIFNWVPFLAICIMTGFIGTALYTHNKYTKSDNLRMANRYSKSYSTNVALTHNGVYLNKIDYLNKEKVKIHKNNNGIKSIHDNHMSHLVTKELIVMNDHIINEYNNSSSSKMAPKEDIDNYTAWSDETYRWIKSHESDHQWVSVSNINVDSIEYDLAEKLLLQSVIHNYKSKKRALLVKMTGVQNEKEALDYITNSKEWEQMVQYEKWVNQFLRKHPGTFNRLDSLSIY